MNVNDISWLKDKVGAEDVVYEVIRKKKATKKSILLDVLIDPAVSLLSDAKDGFISVYLVASNDKGTLYVCKSENDIEVINIDNWEKYDKEDFKSAVVGDYIYKKYRKLAI